MLSLCFWGSEAVRSKAYWLWFFVLPYVDRDMLIVCVSKAELHEKIICMHINALWPEAAGTTGVALCFCIFFFFFCAVVFRNIDRQRSLVSGQQGKFANSHIYTYTILQGLQSLILLQILIILYLLHLLYIVFDIITTVVFIVFCYYFSNTIAISNQIPYGVVSHQ